MMKYRYMSDCHTHTTFSPDGYNTLEEMCNRAVELGLTYYAVTDHYESNFTQYRLSSDDKEYWGFNFYEKSAQCYEQMCEMQAALRGEINFIKGLELGQAHQNIENTGYVLENKEYDFILGSVHNIRDFEDFYFLDYDNQEEGYIDSLLNKYFDEEKEMIALGNFDSISHLTYPLRYIEGVHKHKVSLESHMKDIEEIFSIVIDLGKAIEINTSGLRQELKDTMPGLELIRKYRQMGGKYITIGSDAHKKEDLCKGIEEGMDILKAAGFDAYTVFINRQPVEVPIIEN